ncbi:MAG: TonB-dependent receptor [Bacteroidota bacterium]
MRFSSLFILLFSVSFLQAQKVEIEVLDSINGQSLQQVLLVNSKNVVLGESDQSGKILTFLENQVSYRLYKEGYMVESFTYSEEKSIILKLKRLRKDLKEVIIQSRKEDFDFSYLPTVQGTYIYGGMKNEVIDLEKTIANLSQNNSRQVYNKIPGLNIWENDGAGIQLGIATRGLSPNRTSHFNTRQNYYEMSADALGYPESYYTPALQSVEKIELVRGAAALQFGTQFGGLLNFKMKRADYNDSLRFSLEQSIISFGLNDTVSDALAGSSTFFNLKAGSKNIRYYGHYQYKFGQGWRDRSDYEVHSTFNNLGIRLSNRSELNIDFTHMHYLAEQAGGLIDDDFNENPRAITRNRNWFQVKWNLWSASYSFEPNSNWLVNSNFFGLNASRQALGFLGQTNRPDPGGLRDIISSEFNNFGNETRVLFRQPVRSGFVLINGGFRFYRGNSQTTEAKGNSGAEANFEILKNPEDEFSEFDFPNQNFAAFAQSVIPLSEKLSISPGLRYENIKTEADGVFNSVVLDGAGNLIEDTLIESINSRVRDFVLIGMGISYKLKASEFYANAVQNYRAINFTDIQINSTSLRIDPNIKDERGSNFDLGYRGTFKDKIKFDLSLFALFYNDRIGGYFTTNALNQAIRFRTNVADARTFGLESYAEYLWKVNASFSINSFANGSLMDAKYYNSEDPVFDNKNVELVPEKTLRLGQTYRYKMFGASLLYSFIDQQFSDATNVGSNPNFPSTPNAVDGIIPAYSVIDLSLSYRLSHFKLSFNLNNLANNHYFTRRASGYPGPGIIPSDGRNFSFSLLWSPFSQDF